MWLLRKELERMNLRSGSRRERSTMGMTLPITLARYPIPFI